MPPALASAAGRLTVQEILAAADSFESQLTNLLSPRLCPKCIHAFSNNLWDETRGDSVPLLLEHSHDFLNAAARFVSVSGGLEDLSALRHVLDLNSNACTSKHRHIYAFHALGDSVHCTMDALCRCLCAAISIRPNKKHRNILLSRNGLWPSKLDDIAPATVAPYVRWACAIPTAWPLSLVCRLLGVARRSVIRAVLETPTRHMLLATFVRAFRLWEVLDSEFPSDARPFISPDGPPIVPEPAAARAIMHQASATIFALQEGPDRRLDDFARLADGYELMLHNAIAETLSKGLFTRDYEKDALIRAAAILAVKVDSPDRALVQDYLYDPDAPPLTEDITLADAVYCYLTFQRGSLMCSGPDCDRLARDDADGGGPLSLCSRCKFARYCGTACQRLDWTAGRNDVPHKIACRALCKLHEAGIFGKGATMYTFSAAYFKDGLLTTTEYGALTKLTLSAGILPETLDEAISRVQVAVESARRVGEEQM